MQYQKTRRVKPERLNSIIGWAERLGFRVESGMRYDTGFWNAFYNLRHAEPIRDWSGAVRPRIYSPGALGLQIEYDNRTDSAIVKVWRN